MSEYILLEELFVELFENEVALEFLLEDGLNEEDPDLLNADDGLSHASVVLDDSVENLAEGLGFVRKRNDHLVVLANFLPYLPPQVRTHLLVPTVCHVARRLRKHLIVERVHRVVLRKGLVNQEVVVVRITPLQLLLSYHLHLLQFVNQSVTNPVHELLDVFFKNTEKQVRRDLETPLLQSLRQPQQLLEVLRQLVVIVHAVEAELDIRLNLLVVLHELLHSQRLNVLRDLIKVRIVHHFTYLLYISLVARRVFEYVQILNFLERSNVIILCVCEALVGLHLVIVLRLLLIIGILLRSVVINDLILVIRVHLIALTIKVVVLLVVRVHCLHVKSENQNFSKHTIYILGIMLVALRAAFGGIYFSMIPC